MRKAAGSSSDKGAWDSGCTDYHSIDYVVTFTMCIIYTYILIDIYIYDPIFACMK